MLEHKYELTKFQKYALKYLKENGFEISLKKEYISKTIYIVSKDGYTNEWHCMNNIANSKAGMKAFQDWWDICYKCYLKGIE